MKDPVTLDFAQGMFRRWRTNAAAGGYLSALITYEQDDMIGDDTFLNGLTEIADWLRDSG